MSDRRTRTFALASSSARTADGESAALDLSRFTEALLYIDVTAASGTAPTLDFDVEAGPADDELGFIHTGPAQITAAGKVLVKLTNLGEWFRLSWDIGGTTPSFTFEAKLTVKT